MFAWVQHLADERYFDIVEIFFLFAGHTHSPIDQNFSVVNHAISRSSFIGSTVAMNELLKVAHDVTDQKNKNTRITEVINLDIYYDYVSYYDEVLNPLVHNHQGPHRYKVEFQKLWGISNVQYMWQSPHTSWQNLWLPVALPPAEDDMNVEASIDNSPYMTFGGKEKMLDTLEIDSTKKMGETLFMKPSTVEAAASKFNAATKAMPILSQIEIQATAEQIARMELEANEGRPAKGGKKQSIRVSKGLRATVEAQMLSANNANAGHLLFLKRSLCKDGSWQDKRPSVLPNPKSWREQATGNGMSNEDIIAVTLSSSEIQELSAGANSKGKAKRTAEDVAKDNAVTKLLKFNNGASQMVKTAKYMLDLLDGGVRVQYNPSMDIVEATQTFKRPILTERDKKFYENISSIANIKKVVEKRVADAEAQQWSLLRLPIVEGVELRRQQLKLEQESVLAKRAENINRLLNKVHDGFDITRETITRDGKEVVFAKTLDDMNIEQLTMLARNAKITGRSKLTKKPQLIAAINKYLSENPTETLKSLCGEEDVIRASTNADSISYPRIDATTSTLSSIEVGATTTNTDLPITTTSIASLCPVQECNGQGIVPCALCGLQFCKELHGAHSSHVCQQLKTGYSWPDVWEVFKDPSSGIEMDQRETEIIGATIIAETSNPSDTFQRETEIIDTITIAEMPNPSHQVEGCTSFNTSESCSQPEPSPLTTSVFKDKLISVASRKEPFILESEVLALKRREPETAPEVVVAKKLRAIVSANCDISGEARKLLNYESYNTEFLVRLANVLNIDIRDIVSVRRTTREGVMKALISKLNC
jgi:hypothetical protein